MSTRDPTDAMRGHTPTMESLDTSLEALDQEALIGLILFQRWRIAELQEERRVLVRTVTSQQRLLRSYRAFEAPGGQDPNRP